MEKKTEQRIFTETLQQVVGERFGRYSKYIIQDRALPDVRDGLKPVQRRILYAMYAEGNTNTKAFRKSAKTVGNVIGNYHPHGDSSVYEAMVRMSQDWKMAIPLVQMHGNNGSIDGDSAAAMRYTEARLSAISELLLSNIDKDTVDFIPNFDDTHTEPTVLPSRYPNLLVNGSTGISAGYATDIPPHNIKEIMAATMHLIKHPKATLADLMKFVKGPDFPGGGIVQGIDGIKSALGTGKGKVIVRSKVTHEVVKNAASLVITEIPYEVNKANLVRQMDEIRVNKNIDGIAEVRDESDRNGFRIVVDLKKDAPIDAIENYFYKNTDLQVNYNYNMVAIYNGRPVLMGIKQILTAYIEHQINVLTRRTNFDLQKALKRSHIVEGLIKALTILDQVIQTIRSSSNRQNAINNLMEAYGFTEQQADAIVSLQLYRLTNTDVVSLEKEAAELRENITTWSDLLSDEGQMRKQLIIELKANEKLLGIDRRSIIENEISEIVIEAEALISKRTGILTITRDGYIKFTSQRSFNASNGKNHGHKPTDMLIGQYEVENNQTVIAITSGGSYLFVPVHLIPELKWKDTGVHFSTLVQYDTTEKIVYCFGVAQFIEQTQQLVLASKNGNIKKVNIADMQLQRYSKAAKIMMLKSDDSIVSAQKIACSATANIALVSKNGYVNCFGVAEVPVAGLKTQGVKSMKLDEDDCVRGMVIGNDRNALVVFTDRATLKRVSFSTLEYTGRYKKGNRIIKAMKTQKYEIVAAVEYGVQVQMQNAEMIVPLLLDRMLLSDLQTVGKKIEQMQKIDTVIVTDIAIIENEKITKKKKILDDITKTTEELELLLEKQGELFDEK
ncbi:DNA gyrase GyrA [Erysipelotrichaceae bacterium]|nr:DNA gyrase GyrA [Erysipelotrichaceae bacterium]